LAGHNRRLVVTTAALALASVLSATHARAVPMTSWDAEKNGDPKTYDIGGLSLTLSSVKDETASFPVLTIRAKGAPSFTIRADNGGYAQASFGVGRFDPKGGDRQVVFTYFTGGAHCCDAVLLAELGKTGWRTVDLGQWDGGFATPPVDIDGDGTVDFVFVDQRFLYAFGCFACGLAPPQIMNVVDGKVRDVSTAPGLRQLFEKSMVEAKAGCEQGANGVCAGYVADGARLGRFDEAWAFMLAHYDRKDDWDYPKRCIGKLVAGECKGQEIKPADFPQSLKWFLEDNGYIARTP
jgi:hypothetical protein